MFNMKRENVENKPASSLVVPLGKTLGSTFEWSRSYGWQLDSKTIKVIHRLLVEESWLTVEQTSYSTYFTT